MPGSLAEPYLYSQNQGSFPDCDQRLSAPYVRAIRVMALQRRFDRAEEQYKLAVDMCSRLLGCVVLAQGASVCVGW